MITVHDALEFLIYCMRNPREHNHSHYGYEVWLPHIIYRYLSEIRGISRPNDSREQREISPFFYEASWELARKGYTRPGIKQYQDQDVSGGISNGFCLTESGRRWLKNFDEQPFIPADLTRLSEVIDQFGSLLGPGFLQRAHEAAQCYSGNLYYATCSMVGAAAESILIRVAISKTGDEASVLAKYRTRSGRQTLINELVGQKPDRLQVQFKSLMELINYRRDEASHGTTVEFSEFEAYDALSRLLRLGYFAKDNWSDLCSS